MSSVRTFEEYRARLLGLLRTAEVQLPPSRLAGLREGVHRKRNPRRGERTQREPNVLEPHLTSIVALLNDASRSLRPRETQELDDLVAGKPERVPVVPTYPTRLHRRGTGRS